VTQISPYGGKHEQYYHLAAGGQDVQAQKMASGLGTTPEELVRASVEDLLGRPKEFQEAVDYVLKKNEELYRRLA